MGQVILTAALAQFLREHQGERIEDIDLPIGTYVLKRLRDEALRLQASPRSTPPDSTTLPRLVGGPYRAPEVRRGDTLLDEERGELAIVGGYTNAPIPWPCRLRAGKAGPILCGDLVEAVRRESVAAIVAWWGINPVNVARWRRCLGVPQMNEGTAALYRELAPAKLTPAVSARGRLAALQPEAVAKMRATKVGRPVSPNTRAALLRAAKAPKSEAWCAQVSLRQLGRRRSSVTIARIRAAVTRSHEIVPLVVIAEERGIPARRLARIALRLSDAGLLRMSVVAGELSTSRYALAKAEAAETRQRADRIREYQAEYRQRQARAKAAGDIMRLGADLHKRTKR